MKKKFYKWAGACGIVLGVYLMAKGNKWGSIPFGIGLGMVLWRY
jgi:drug/metabolite transporter (DMT)-like permease